MTNAEKALDLCIKKVRLMNDIKALSKKIGDGLLRCTNNDIPSFLYIETESGYLPHLIALYHYKNGPHRAQLLMDVESCPQCSSAHQLVQDRRRLKRQLAGVNGAMTKLGSSVLNMEGKK